MSVTVIRHHATPTGFIQVVTYTDSSFGFTAAVQEYILVPNGNGRTSLKTSNPYSTEEMAISYFLRLAVLSKKAVG